MRERTRGLARARTTWPFRIGLWARSGVRPPTQINSAASSCVHLLACSGLSALGTPVSLRGVCVCVCACVAGSVSLRHFCELGAVVCRTPVPPPCPAPGGIARSPCWPGCRCRCISVRVCVHACVQACVHACSVSLLVWRVGAGAFQCVCLCERVCARVCARMCVCTQPPCGVCSG